ncbi:MAG: DUF3293 domain-containing protein [Rhodanobacteraceae bacterium]|nr:DUF3293 domain-containing protein [Rhodanobacteraceae bacterium]
MDAPARILALLAAYRATHYEVFLPDGTSATIHVGQPPPHAVATWLGAAPFAAFLTACNPHSHALPEEENRQRLDALRRRLQAHACRLLDGVGHLPGETWHEPSLLVAGLTFADVDALVREFDQNAVVIVHAHGVARLRLYRPEWHAVAGYADDLEWA